MTVPENAGVRKSKTQSFRSMQSEEDIMDVTLARETRVDRVKAEIARIEARKKRFQQKNSDIFSFVLNYFGCC